MCYSCHRNHIKKIALFHRQQVRTPSKEKLQLAALKNDCNLFFRPYVSCQTCDDHENPTALPSLSSSGGMRFGTKYDILHCLDINGSESILTSTVDAQILDCAALSEHAQYWHI